MAGKTATKGKTTKKAAPAPEPVEEAADELELDEVEADEVEESPAKGKGKGGQQEVTFGASDLAAHLSKTSGKKVTARELRTLIRKMARDGSGRVQREITAGNRTRYNWSGVDDPEVKKIIAAFEGGELEADKQAKLAELKENKAKKKAAGEPTGKKGKKGAKAKKAEAAKVEETEDEDEDLELDD